MRVFRTFAPTLALFIFCWSYFYPGFLSQDSWAQLAEARSGVFRDWHPPIMAWLWAQLLRIWDNPANLLFLHLGVFFSALGLWSTYQSRPLRSFTLALALFPPIFALLGAVWKDVGLGIGLLFLFAGARHVFKQDPRRRFWLLAFIPLVVYVGAIRHNAAPALIPLAYWIADACTRHTKLRGKFFWNSGAACAFIAVIALTNQAITRCLLKGGTSTHPVQQILLHDLAALSIESRANLIPHAFRASPAISLADIEKNYTTRGVVPLFCCDPKVAPLVFSQRADDLRELRGVWLQAVRADPGAYFQHRWRNFRGQLGLERGAVCNPYLRRDPPAKGWRHLIDSGLEKIQHSFLFRGWIYFILSIALLGALAKQKAWKQSEGRFAIALLSSGLAYTLPYFFVSTACDFRMHWWLVLSATFGLLEVRSLQKS